MEVPPDPQTGPDRSQDAFDFSQGALGLPADLARQIREAAEGLTGMGAEQRRHLTIAMTAVGATWIAPVLAARRRRKRRRRKPA
ncbi:MAG: hypothetical protein OXH12_04620 [Chloroflexi bacterium]|nr:hypothetical protein [Chloroflexota bacterium]